MERIQKDINVSMRAILIDWLVEVIFFHNKQFLVLKFVISEDRNKNIDLVIMQTRGVWANTVFFVMFFSYQSSFTPFHMLNFNCTTAGG